MLLKNLALSALVTMSVWGCSTTPSVAPTVKHQPPTSCLTKCDPLPSPVDGSERSVRSWEFDLIEAAGQCRRLHADCVEWESNRGRD